jgi:hypothetical protein
MRSRIEPMSQEGTTKANPTVCWIIFKFFSNAMVLYTFILEGLLHLWVWNVFKFLLRSFFGHGLCFGSLKRLVTGSVISHQPAILARNLFHSRCIFSQVVHNHTSGPRRNSGIYPNNPGNSWQSAKSKQTGTGMWRPTTNARRDPTPVSNARRHLPLRLTGSSRGNL